MNAQILLFLVAAAVGVAGTLFLGMMLLSSFIVAAIVYVLGSVMLAAHRT